MRQLGDEEQTKLYIESWKLVKKEFFKLETLQIYEPTPGLQEFQKGEIEKARRLMKEFLLSDPAYPYEMIKKQGIKFIRLHIIDLPLSNYLKFEIESYKISAQLGEQIFFIKRENLKDLNLTLELKDFLMFDEKIVIVHQYDPQGVWQSSYLIEDPEEIAKYVSLKKILMTKATPMKEFLRDIVFHDKIV
jgi:hypothetical protein